MAIRPITLCGDNMKIQIIGKPGEEVPKNMKLSPAMPVRFPDGQVVAMNRRERRRRHLYGDRVTVNRIRR